MKFGMMAVVHFDIFGLPHHTSIVVGMPFIAFNYAIVILFHQLGCEVTTVLLNAQFWGKKLLSYLNS